MLTAATYHKLPIFREDERLDRLQSAIFHHCNELQWMLQAWAVFANHYHIVALAPEAPDLKRLVKRIHGSTGRYANELDECPGRIVWYNYWDTQLTIERSYLARLNYVHQNAVRHGLARRAEDYRYCSMSWFVANADSPFRDSVLSFPIDRVNVPDDF